MPNKENFERPHNLTVENRKILKATGISDVEGFDETKVYAMLENLAFTVTGKGLMVTSFSKETGDLKVEGEINSVTYQKSLSRKAGLLARIFK